MPGDLLAQAVAAGASPNLPRQAPMMVPIETPLMFSGFHENVLRDFGPLFEQLGITAVQGGGAASATYTAKPAAGLAEFAASGRSGRGRAGFRAI